DGIRDFHVTGVQTCALPIFTEAIVKVLSEQSVKAQVVPLTGAITDPEHDVAGLIVLSPVTGFTAEHSLAALKMLQSCAAGLRRRSEERRVGKGCGARRSHGQ